MSQGTLAFTNRLLFRVFTCNSFGLHQLTVIYTSSNIHSTHLIQRTVQCNTPGVTMAKTHLDTKGYEHLWKNLRSKSMRALES
jgi:hypothetical protein